MPFTIRPATVADAAALTEVYLSSFHADAIGVLVFKDTAATRKFWTDSVLEEIADPHSHFLCAIDTDSAGTELQIAGYAKWNTPAAPHPDPNDLPQWPEGGDHELANHFFGTLFRKHEEIMGDRKHWYLEIIAVAKEYQGKGAGGMLVKWGVEKADEDGVAAFLEATASGMPVYKRYGFEEKGSFTIDMRDKDVVDDEYLEVFMVREPKEN